MTEGIYSIDIDLQSGDAIIALVDEDQNVEVARVDSGCTIILDGSFLPIQGIPNSVFIEQDQYGILPFSIEAIESSGGLNSQLDFTIDRYGDDVLFDQTTFFPSKKEIEGELESSEDEIEVNSPRTKIQIWGDATAGIRGLKFGSLLGLAHEEKIEPDETIRLPRFTWSSSGVDINSILLVGRENGQIDQYIFKAPASARDEGFTINSSILPELSPLRSNPIEGITSNKNSPYVYISSRRGVAFLNPENLKIDSFVKTPQDLILGFHTSENVLWGTSPSEGSIYKIYPKDYEEPSSSSTEIESTSSSSFSSFSSSSASSVSSASSSSSQGSSLSSSSSSSLSSFGI